MEHVNTQNAGCASGYHAPDSLIGKGPLAGGRQKQGTDGDAVNGEGREFGEETGSLAIQPQMAGDAV